MERKQPPLLEVLLNADGIVKMSTFLMYAACFKGDILLAMDAKSATNVPPPFLPASIASLLALLCDLSDEAIDMLWGLLKDVVWNWKAKVQVIDEHYQLYGHNLCYHRFSCNILV